MMKRILSLLLCAVFLLPLLPMDTNAAEPVTVNRLKATLSNLD